MNPLKDRPGVSPTYQQIKADLSVVILIAFLLIGGRELLDIGKDSTDAPDSRSGMALRVDYLTGCHYLESTKGVLIPRQTADGYHLCK